ncbi:hypothetical protein AGMMS50276_30560 [Synergistales bacterium]|nr:hypothetical protein AGMMS50276_30560 [Synergistales bacterium]
MTAVNYSDALNNFEGFRDTAVRDFETIIVTRGPNENVVIMSDGISREGRIPRRKDVLFHAAD